MIPFCAGIEKPRIGGAAPDASGIRGALRSHRSRLQDAAGMGFDPCGAALQPLRSMIHLGTVGTERKSGRCPP